MTYLRVSALVECTLLSIRHNTGSLERKHSILKFMFYVLCNFPRESFYGFSGNYNTTTARLTLLQYA